MKKVDVCHRVLDVGGEVCDLAAAAGAREVEVDPAEQDLLGGELHELLERLAVLEKGGEAGVGVKVDVGQQTVLDTTNATITTLQQTTYSLSRFGQSN